MRIIFLVSLFLVSCSNKTDIFIGPNKPGNFFEPNLSPSRFKHAAVHYTIAPWDGQAIMLLLSDTPIEKKHPKQSYVSIAIYKTGVWNSTDPIQIEKGDLRSGSIFWHELNKDQVELEWAEVQFDKIPNESPAEGFFDLKMPDGSRERGTFQAKWLPSDGSGG
jgi:hypothetical protein